MDFYLTSSASPFPCFQITWITSLCNLHIEPTSIPRRLRKNCKRCSTAVFNVLSNETINRITNFSFHKNFKFQIQKHNVPSHAATELNGGGLSHRYINSLFAHDVITCNWAPSWLTLGSLF